MSIDNTATFGSCAEKARLALEPKYGPGEARALVRIIFEELNGYSPVDLIVKSDVKVTPWLQRKVSETVSRLLDDEPIQYIFGHARFHGLTLNVNKSTLIPRPETEELVDMITDRYRSQPDLCILDVCTGSGCIAIALARTLPFSRITGTDISDAALDVARENNRILRTDVNFINADALHMPDPEEHMYDIIVSNPPYIAESEKKDMPDNVLRYEPSQALFVPDADPLLFYKAISSYAIKALKPGGTIWFEINPLYAADVSAMLGRTGFTDIDILPDMQRKLRFAYATAPAS
ncbi:MAG: peptide chain release factor N(5)-glutamine methyltransferase [Muribaculaceae bacterium]|nr:peptide chain release factor N(5)-glutamine methyltransferase [Muribaculaceae bacterium]